MELDKGKIIEALRSVNDPSTGKDIIDAQMVSDLKTDGQNISFTITTSNVDGDTKSKLNFACQEAVLRVFPDANVHVHLSMKSPFAKEEVKVLPQVKNIIAVASGKGGVGKSTVSTNLALGLRELGLKVGLLDADLYGPSIPTMMGLKGKRPQVQDVKGKPMIIPLYAHGIPVMSIGFIIEAEQAVVLRGPRLGAIIKQFFNDCLWPELDYLIIDLPPGTGDIQLTLVQTVPVTGAIMVTTPQDVAIADALKAMNMFLLPSVNVPILGVVENMSWFTPEELPDSKYHIFGSGGGEKLAELGGVEMLGQIPIVMSIRTGGDDGTPVVLNKSSKIHEAFMSVASKTAEQVDKRNNEIDPTVVVKMATD